MKRVIEIEDKDYELICDVVKGLEEKKASAPTDWFAIAHSKPYCNGEDCIDRKAFKSHFCKVNCGERQCVDHSDRCIFIDELMQFATVEERPQGEWQYGEDECGQDGWFCSECGFFVPWYYQYYENDINFIREYKACPHCLAEMVTYTGKDRDTKGGAV